MEREIQPEIDPKVFPEIKTDDAPAPEISPGHISPELKPNVQPEVKPDILPEIKPNRIPPEIVADVKTAGLLYGQSSAYL